MKSIIEKVLLILLCFTAMLSGCSTSDSGYDPTWTTDSACNSVMQDNGRTTIFPDTLPVDVPYNDTHISVSSIKAYQDNASYNYTVYLVVQLDVSELSDSELHWLRKSDLSVDAYLTNEANNHDFQNMPTLGRLLHADGKTLQYVLTTSFFDENRYPFEKSDLTLSIDIKQEDTYTYTNSEGENTKLNKTISISYSTTLPETLPNSETIPKPLYGYVAEWLAEWSDKYLPK